MLADDIEALHEARGDITTFVAQARPPIDRIIAILEPLAGLSDEQVEHLVCDMLDAIPGTMPERAHAYGALAASLTALRGKR